MEKEELVEGLETNEAIPRAVGKLEGDASTIWNDDHKKEIKEEETQSIVLEYPKFGNEQDDASDKISSQVVKKQEGDAFTNDNVDDKKEPKEVKVQNIGLDGVEFDNEHDDKSDKIICSQVVENQEGDAFIVDSEDHDKELKDEKIQNIDHYGPACDSKQDDKVIDVKFNTHEEMKDNVTGVSEVAQRVDDNCDSQCGPQQENLETNIVPEDLFQKVDESYSMESEILVNMAEEEFSSVKLDGSGYVESKSQEASLDNSFGHNDLVKEKDDSKSMESTQINKNTYNNTNEDSNLEPVSDGIKVPGENVDSSTSIHTLDTNPETPLVVERAAALRKFVRERGAMAVMTMLQRLSGRSNEGALSNSDDVGKDASERDNESKDVSEKTMENMTHSPLHYIKMSSDVNAENKTDHREEPIIEGPPQPIAMKGRIILYTRLGCQESKEVRKFLYSKRLRYVEINIDVYPSRKVELEKRSGSTSVPKVFFNEILIGNLSELKALDESGKLDEKIDFLITEAPSFESPLPPLSGEDDLSSSGSVDEMALIVRKMQETIVVKDRFSKLRRFTNCFLGSEAVDFLSEDQYLERKEAVEFARKLASKLFFQHVLEENMFEDGNHFYRFMDDDPIVASQCHNIPRGIITVKPKHITEIASRLRFLSYAMFEAYVSEDGRHVDYRSMHGSEEFARYLRIAEELQRVEIRDLSREEKLAFFINLYNMMTIHAILVWGHPNGALERRRLFADFKYVIGGSTYSLSAIQNGILRGNQRPPYTLMKTFGAKDKRLRVALLFPEPLIHFALEYGTRSGPALRCYSPGDIDQELMDAARDFLRNGGILIDFTAKVAYASKILKWFSVDFGKNEVEVMKHVSNYLDPADSELLLDLLATSELKVIYQPYDWGLNC